MSGNFVMKMHMNSNNRNKQITKPQPPSTPPPPPKKNNFNLRTVINTPMRSAISQNAGKADCGCGSGRH
jgi:hypothetical protein